MNVSLVTLFFFVYTPAISFSGGFRVFFVALVQSFSHYNNVAQKLVSTKFNAMEGSLNKHYLVIILNVPVHLYKNVPFRY